jgi:long-subunit fatty acid transport protein
MVTQTPTRTSTATALRPRARWLALTACWLFPSAAWAGNVDSFYMSGGAALQAGAITADSQGGGAIWYNPAGLAKLPDLRFDVSINAVSLKIGGQPDIDAQGTSSVVRLTTFNLNIIPAGLTLTRRFGKVGVGLGVFVPEQRQTFLRTKVDTLEANGEQVSSSVGYDAYDRVQQYAAGPSLGASIARYLDLGTSLLFTYRNQLRVEGVDVGLGDATSAGSLTTHQTLDWQQLGAQLVVGLQLHPTSEHSIGFTLRFPALSIFELRQNVAVQTTVVDGSTSTAQPASDFRENLGFTSTTFVSPLRCHLGISRTIGKSRVAVEASYQAPIHNAELDLDWVPTLNTRLGARHQLTETLALGGGVFTDRSPVRHATQFGESTLDFYGATLAFDTTTRYRVTPLDQLGEARSRDMRFGTTVALTYAVGFGEVVRASVGAAEGGTTLTQTATPTVAHELLFHLGSSLGE